MRESFLVLQPSVANGKYSYAKLICRHVSVLKPSTIDLLNTRCQYCKNLLAHFRTAQNIHRPKIFTTENRQQNVAKPDQVKSEVPLRKIEVVIKIDPAILSILLADKNMVPSDISMLETMVVVAPGKHVKDKSRQFLCLGQSV
jgi:hypothetical protein